jgi:hypothetical protein
VTTLAQAIKNEIEFRKTVSQERDAQIRSIEKELYKDSNPSQFQIRRFKHKTTRAHVAKAV